MQHDEMIWHVVNHQFCSFKTTIGKAKSDKTHFCRNPYSVTGLCNRTSCPLANSKYATIREDNGRIYLCVKTVERAHSPKNLWEKLLLSRNYGKALLQLDEHLAYFPKVLIHRNKQRLTKIHQYLIRMRKIEVKQRAGKKAKLVGVHRKVEQREERRERKALVAAKIERNIEKELIERLAKGTYGDIYNFPETSYQKALDAVEEAESTVERAEEEVTDEEIESMVEYVEDLESEEEHEEDVEDMEYLGSGNWGEIDHDDESETDDVENDDGICSDDVASSSDDDRKDANRRKAKKERIGRKISPRREPRIEIEYEEEPGVENASTRLVNHTSW
jgi:protein MAK16